MVLMIYCIHKNKKRKDPLIMKKASDSMQVFTKALVLSTAVFALLLVLGTMMSLQAASADMSSLPFNNQVTHMMEDYQGNLWFTSARQGLLFRSSLPRPSSDISEAGTSS